MGNGRITFDGVWKKFRRGERHDSLRDLLPAVASKLFRRGKPQEISDDEFWVLRDVSFQVESGQALGIIGRNGAGKSTTLKLLTRILRPTRGTASVSGRVGALIEIAAGFHPDLTGRENVFLQGAILGMRRPDIQRNFDAIVAFAELDDFIDTPVKRYSSGMNARLGFSVAAHLNPEVLLIDEVLAVGDMKFQQKCMEKLREFRSQGLAIAFVSHNMQAIASLCDRAILLRPGASPLNGTVDEVITAYAAGAAATGDDRVTLLNTELLDCATGQRVTGAIEAGGMLALRLKLQVHADLPRCGIHLWIHRSDGLSIFDGVSYTDGLSPISLDANTTAEALITFSPHVLRGMYTIGVSLVDPDRRWPAVPMPSVASFVVSETTRWGGCVEMRPAYEFVSSARDAAATVPHALTGSAVRP